MEEPLNPTSKDQQFSMNTWPNPTTGDVSLSYVMPNASDVEVLVTDIMGRQIASHKIKAGQGENTLHLQFGNMPNGVYLCVLKTQDGQTTKKILKE
jgi:hypothetical protein